MATKPVGGRRLVLWAVLDGYVCSVAESQIGGPPWKLEEQWDRTGWARPRMPRTADQLKKLTDEVIAWIPTGAGHLYLVNRRNPLSVLVRRSVR
jgi:hypothetical protein